MGDVDAADVGRVEDTGMLLNFQLLQAIQLCRTPLVSSRLLFSESIPTTGLFPTHNQY